MSAGDACALSFMRKKLPVPAMEALQAGKANINRKQAGEMIEVAFMLKAIQLGFAVTKPYGDSEAYDFIVDSGVRLWRVQVKSSHSKKNSSYFIGTSRNCASPKPYTPEEIDFVVAYTTPDEAWYVIPASEIMGRGTICLHPHMKNSPGLYERFRDAWCLMACTRNPNLRKNITTRPLCGSCGSCRSGCGCPLMEKGGKCCSSKKVEESDKGEEKMQIPRAALAEAASGEE